VGVYILAYRSMIGEPKLDPNPQFLLQKQIVGPVSPRKPVGVVAPYIRIRFASRQLESLFCADACVWKRDMGLGRLCPFIQALRGAECMDGDALPVEHSTLEVIQ